jgi:glycerol-3-phosphate dehydrogenase
MKNRSRIIELASAREYDLIVIGGGIVGAGIAQNAAVRGLSVLLVEKDDFASHTSSKTTKLIHGGLRYLESWQFKLTYQLSRERNLLEQLAPHLVKEISFVLPFRRGETLFSWKASLGLSLYDLLAFNFSHSHQPHGRLSPQEIVEAAPALSQDNLIGGLRFHDAITDDSRLVLAVLKSASDHGAHIINYMEAVALNMEGNTVHGIECRDRLSSKTISLRGKVCVNAAGIFSDDVLRLVKDTWKSRLVPSKGIHIVLPLSAFPTNTGLLLPTADKRYIFVLPWQRSLLVGPTDTLYHGNLNLPLPDNDEMDYLLNTVNQYNGKHHLNRGDIVAAWAGIRPLISPPSSNNSSTSALPREHRIFAGPKGLINVIGGKLTNYRLMAEEAVNYALSRFPHIAVAKGTAERTKRLMLGGWLDKEDFLTSTAVIASRARKLSLDPATIDHLISTYGKEALAILDLIEEESDLKERICPEFPPMMAEIIHCVQNEMAISLEDFLARRIRLAMLHHKLCLEAAPKVAVMMQSLLGWDNNRLEAELQALSASLSEQLPSPFLSAT